MFGSFLSLEVSDSTAVCILGSPVHLSWEFSINEPAAEQEGSQLLLAAISGEQDFFHAHTLATSGCGEYMAKQARAGRVSGYSEWSPSVQQIAGSVSKVEKLQKRCPWVLGQDNSWSLLSLQRVPCTEVEVLPCCFQQSSSQTEPVWK